MKKHKLSFRTVNFSLLALLVFLASCSKLTEEPKSFITPAAFYQTTGQVEAVFASSMNDLWNIWSNYSYTTASHAFVNDDQLYQGNLVTSQNWGSGLWSGHYAAIMNLNAAIAALKKGSVQGATPTDIDILMGQAKFLRGWNYFQLVRMFGDLPLITDSLADPYTAKIARSPIADVYNLIISDFTEAYTKLPPTWAAAQQGRPTSDVAKALLAKAYLTMATYPMNQPAYYKKAADLAGQVIDAGRYSLVKDINNVFSLSTKYGPEMMWSFNSNFADQATDPYMWTWFSGWHVYAAQPEWAVAYPEQPRKYAYIQMTDPNGASYLSLGLPPGLKKFLQDPQSDYDAGLSTINFPIIRYADVLLIFAEADNMANGGPSVKGVAAINQVIDRANGYVSNTADPDATTTMAQADFDTKVIQERNYELCFEFDRWFDLIRKHILKQASIPSIQQNFSESEYLWPIPLTDIKLNPLLKQNPGY